jgi:hypothetical protein
MKIELSLLIPTQTSVGLHQVKKKAKKIGKMNTIDLKQYLRERPVPVVNRNGKFYMIDRHHLCSACIIIGIKKVKIIMTDDFSGTSKEYFWTLMDEKKYVLLQDSNGKQITVDMLPKTLSEMSDDPYRSLAGLIRGLGVIKKVNIPFSEFAWANFFRKYFNKKEMEEMLHSNTDNDMILQSIRLAKSKSAKDIPGYIVCDLE